MISCASSNCYNRIRSAEINADSFTHDCDLLTCKNYKSRELPNFSMIVDVGDYLLVPVSHATTAAGRGARCFFFNVGD